LRPLPPFPAGLLHCVADPAASSTPLPFPCLDLAAEAVADMKAGNLRCRRGGADEAGGGEPKARRCRSRARRPAHVVAKVERRAGAQMRRSTVARDATPPSARHPRRVASSPLLHVVLVTPPADPRASDRSSAPLGAGAGLSGSVWRLHPMTREATVGGDVRRDCTLLDT
jgi:hypothetical protein